MYLSTFEILKRIKCARVVTPSVLYLCSRTMVPRQERGDGLVGLEGVGGCRSTEGSEVLRGVVDRRGGPEGRRDSTAVGRGSSRHEGVPETEREGTRTFVVGGRGVDPDVAYGGRAGPRAPRGRGCV